MNSIQKPYPNLGQSIWLLFLFFIFSIPMGFIQYFFGEAIDESWVMFFSYSIPIILVCFYGLNMKPEGVLNQFSFHWPLILLLGSVVNALFLLFVIDPLTSLIPIPDWFIKLMSDLIKPNLPSFLTVVIMAPVFEEILFRGIILNGFLKFYKPWRSILWSAALFAIIHLNPWQAIGAFIIGVYIGWVYWKTRSILPGIFIHFLNNLLGFSLAVYFGNEVMTTRDLFNDSITFWLTYALCLAIMVWIIISIHNYFKKVSLVE